MVKVTVEIEGSKVPIIPEGSGLACRDGFGSVEMPRLFLDRLAKLMAKGVDVRLAAVLEKRGEELTFLSMSLCLRDSETGERIDDWPVVRSDRLPVEHPKWPVLEADGITISNPRVVQDGGASHRPGGHIFNGGVCACGQRTTDVPSRCPLFGY